MQRRWVMTLAVLGVIALAVLGSGDSAAAAGDLDSSFNKSGYALARLGRVSPDTGYAVALQADGKLLAAGVTSAATSRVALTRLNANGTPDAGFGIGGQVSLPFASGVPAGASAVAVQPDGRILIAGWSAPAGGSSRFALARLTAGGSLDPSFGSNGIVTSAIGSSAVVTGMALQTDGRIVVAGSSDHRIAVARYTAAGVLDPTFGIGGIAISVVTAGNDSAAAVRLQADGKVVVAGSTYVGHSVFLALRYTASGVLDSGFGSGGVRTVDLGPRDSAARALLVQSGGRILLGGMTDDAVDNPSRLAVVALTPNGSLDATFGFYGVARVDPTGGDDEIAGMAFTSDGKLVVAGRTSGGANWQGGLLLARLTGTGALDTSFGSNGSVVTELPVRGATARALAISAGTLVVVGDTTQYDSGAASYTYGDLLVARYSAGGSLDPSFGQAGLVRCDFGLRTRDAGTAIAVQPDKQIVVAGTTLGIDDTDVAVIRYLPTGARDTGFGGAGLARFAVGPTMSDDTPTAIAVDPAGRILVAGYTRSPSRTRMFVAALLPNGAPDLGFGNAGLVDFAVGGFDDRLYGLVLPSDGSIVVAGSLYNPVTLRLEIALVRLRPDGAFDPGFGSNGIVRTGLDGEQLEARAVAEVEGGFIVAGRTGGNGPSHRMLSARYDVNGQLDPSFGSSGIALTAIGADAEAEAMALPATGGILLGGRCQGVFCVLALDKNGLPDPAFGSNGVATTPIPGGTSTIYGLGLQSDGGIVATGVVGNGGQWSLALARFKSTGFADPSFAGNSTPTFPLAGNSVGAALRMQPDDRAVVAGSIDNGTTEQFLTLRVLTQ